MTKDLYDQICELSHMKSANPGGDRILIAMAVFKSQRRHALKIGHRWF